MFTANRTGPYVLYQKPIAGAGNEEPLGKQLTIGIPTDWSPDGRFLLCRRAGLKTGNDLWGVSMEENGQPFPVVQTNFNEKDGQFSPDGKWIAYESNESGSFEIYVQPFPGAGAKLQISTNGGAQVRWRRDGKELFYVALDDRLMAVPIRLDSSRQTVDAGAPVPLFATRVGGALQGIDRQQYIVSPDGKRFLMNTVAEETSSSPITVILNWKPRP